MRVWPLVIVFWIAGLIWIEPAFAKSRIALVIGNSEYSRPGWRLSNPTNDARSVAQTLSAVGFEVDLVINANRAQMADAFQRFGSRIRSLGENAESVFYFAGHGAQQDNVNYLVPIDADARTADQLRFQAPAMQFILDDMAQANNAVNIIILDACRDMPLEQGYRSTSGGLADMGRLPNIFVAYSAAPGRTAADGSGSNSPFTAALIQHLSSSPSETIQQLFADVNATVYRNSGGAQSPEYRNGLVRAPRYQLGNNAPIGREPIVSQTITTSAQGMRSTQDSLSSLHPDVLNVVLSARRAAERAKTTSDRANQLASRAAFIAKDFDDGNRTGRVKFLFGDMSNPWIFWGQGNSTGVPPEESIRGLGVISTSDGTPLFEGEINGLTLGMGRMWRSSFVYYGEFAPGDPETVRIEPSGYGRFIGRFEILGQFSRGRGNGFATVIYRDAKYEGEVLDDVPNGLGVMWDNNGGFQQGRFSQGRIIEVMNKQ